MSPNDFIQLFILVVLFLTLGVFGLTLWPMWNQMKAMTVQLHLSTSLSRLNAFDRLHAPITEGDVEAFMLDLPEHICLDTFKSRYENNQKRIRSFIKMKRKYLYLLYCVEIEDQYGAVALGSADKWITELTQYQEFADLHERHAGYYPHFAERVDQFSTKQMSLRWQCEELDSKKQ